MTFLLFLWVWLCPNSPQSFVSQLLYSLCVLLLFTVSMPSHSPIYSESLYKLRYTSRVPFVVVFVNCFVSFPFLCETNFACNFFSQFLLPSFTVLIHTTLSLCFFLVSRINSIICMISTEAVISCVAIKFIDICTCLTSCGRLISLS